MDAPLVPGSLVAVAADDGRREAVSFSEALMCSMDQQGDSALPFLECPSNLWMATRVSGELDEAALARSLTALTARHDTLRSTYVTEGETWWRFVAPPAPVAIERFDLAHGSPDVDDRLATLLASLVDTPMAVATGPLFRASIITVAADDRVLLLTINHIAFDAWSRSIVARELQQLYAAFAGGAAPDLPAMTASYGDYVRRQQANVRRLASGGDGPLATWCTRLRGAPPWPGAEDPAVAPASSGERRHCPFVLDDRATAELRQLARGRHITLATVMLAAFCAAVAKCTGLVDLVVGIPVSDRARPEFDAVVGLFANVAVVRVRDIVGGRFGQVLDCVIDAVEQAYADLRTPYGYMVQRSADSAGRLGSYPYVFNFTYRTPSAALAIPGTVSREVTVLPERAWNRSALGLRLHDDGACLRGVLSSRAAFCRGELEAILSCLRELPDIARHDNAVAIS